MVLFPQSRSNLWDFRIEQKLFSLVLSNDGGSVIIRERTRMASFQLKVDVAAAVWMKETLEEALVVGGVGQFMRKYRGSNSMLIAELYSNQKGIFLKFLKISNGQVLRGNILWGWKKMMICLDKIVGRRPVRREADRSFVSVTKAADSPNNPVKQLSEDYKSWKMAVTLYRSNTKLSWGEISRKLEAITRRKSEVLPLAADRAIYWCLKEQEIKELLDKSFQLSSTRTNVTLGRWKKDDHW